MNDFEYSIVHTMDKDEYDKNIFEFGSKESVINWLWDNIGPGGILPDENKMWTNTLEYPGPGLISVVHHFKDPNHAMLFALRWS